MGTSFVFIDSRVADIDSLLSDMPSGSEVVIINGASNGLDQIVASLQGRSGIDAIHIISHGSSGSISLGDSVIDSDALATHAIQLETIGQSLTESGDILLYGCNIAAGGVGLQFIGSLAQATGADVASSTDWTGAEALSGDWILEQSIGTIDVAVLHSEGYSSVLPGAQLISTIFETTGGYYTTFAELSKAAYHLAPEEQLHSGQTVSNIGVQNGEGQNYIKPYADDAWTQVTTTWTILTNSELQMNGSPWLSADNASGSTRGSADGNTWFLESDGTYHCNNAAAFAVVCGDAVVISFRGTNDNDPLGLLAPTADKADWLDMGSHYDELQAFIDAVDVYALNNNIEQIYVTGHSLGGAMALRYMDNHPVNSLMIGGQVPIRFEAVTFAAPGYSDFLNAGFDTRVISIEVDGDPVPDIGPHNGYTVSIDIAGVEHTTSTSILTAGTDYATTDFHSMDLYLEAAKALDQELPVTSDSLTTQHGLSRDIFDLAHSLEISLTGREDTTGADEHYTWGDHDLAPHFALMEGDNTLADTRNAGFTDYFLGGEGQDTIGGPGYFDTLGLLGPPIAVSSVMVGGAGDDTYLVDNATDTIVEKSGTGPGIDLVRSIVSYILPANVENLTLRTYP